MGAEEQQRKQRTAFNYFQLNRPNGRVYRPCYFHFSRPIASSSTHTHSRERERKRVCCRLFSSRVALSPSLSRRQENIFLFCVFSFGKLHISQSIIGIVSSVEICATFLFGKRRSAPRDPVSCRWNQNIDHIPPDEIPTELLFYLCGISSSDYFGGRKKKRKVLCLYFGEDFLGETNGGARPPSTQR